MGVIHAPKKPKTREGAVALCRACSDHSRDGGWHRRRAAICGAPQPGGTAQCDGLPCPHLRRRSEESLGPDENADDHPRAANQTQLGIPVSFSRRSGRTWAVAASVAGAKPDLARIRALRTAHAILERDSAGRPMPTSSPTSPYRLTLSRLLADGGAEHGNTSAPVRRCSTGIRDRRAGLLRG